MSDSLRNDAWASFVVLIIIIKMKKELFNKCLEAVEDATDIRWHKVTQSRTDEAVCARMLLVRVLTDAGFSESDIAEYTFMKQQRINYLKNEGMMRIEHNRLMRKMYDEIRQKMQ